MYSPDSGLSLDSGLLSRLLYQVLVWQAMYQQQQHVCGRYGD